MLRKLILSCALLCTTPSGAVTLETYAALANETKRVTPEGSDAEYGFPFQKLSLGVSARIDEYRFIKESRLQASLSFGKSFAKPLMESGENIEVNGLEVKGLFPYLDLDPTTIPIIGLGVRAERLFIESPYSGEETYRAYYAAQEFDLVLGVLEKGESRTYGVNLEFGIGTARLKHHVSGLRPTKRNLETNSISLSVSIM